MTFGGPACLFCPVRVRFLLASWLRTVYRLQRIKSMPWRKPGKKSYKKVL